MTNYPSIMRLFFSCFIFILFSSLQLLAQATVATATENKVLKKSFGTKVYFSLNTETKTDSLATSLRKTKNLIIGNPLPAFTFFSLNGNFQELVAKEFVFNRSNKDQYAILGTNLDSLSLLNGQIQTLFLLSFDYQYAFRFFRKNPDAKFRVYLGFALNPYMANNKFKPKDLTPTAYPVRQFNFGTSVDIVPRINIQLSKHWFLDVNMPINIGSATWVYTKAEDPNMAVYKHVKQDVLFDRLRNQRTFYLGIGLKI